jgi:hypothetical protein
LLLESRACGEGTDGVVALAQWRCLDGLGGGGDGSWTSAVALSLGWAPAVTSVTELGRRGGGVRSSARPQIRWCHGRIWGLRGGAHSCVVAEWCRGWWRRRDSDGDNLAPVAGVAPAAVSECGHGLAVPGWWFGRGPVVAGPSFLWLAWLVMAWLLLAGRFYFFVNATSLVSLWWWGHRGWMVIVAVPRWCFRSAGPLQWWCCGGDRERATTMTMSRRQAWCIQAKVSTD